MENVPRKYSFSFYSGEKKDTIVTADTSCLMNILVDNCAP